MFHNHYETHFPSRNPTPIRGFHFEVLPRNILSFWSFPKPLRNSNPDLRELTRFRGQVWFGIPGKFLLILPSGTAISHTSNMYCSGRRSKQRIQGQRIIFEGKGSKWLNKNKLCYCLFHSDQKAKNHKYSL